MTSDCNLEITSGSHLPLGSTTLKDGTNFALFSAHAEKVELCIFDKDGIQEIARLELPEYTDEVWHGFVPALKPGTPYGYRVHGKHDPENGHRFNPNKLLLDPYARHIMGNLKWNDALYGYDVNAETDKDLSLSTLDSAPFVMKGVTSDFNIQPFKTPILRPLVPWDKTIIYEAHVRGFTKLHPKLDQALRGTVDGLADPNIISYIKSLGITSVELLPVHAFVDDHTLIEKNMLNNWGYNSIGFFAPQNRYLGAGGLESFRTMVRRYHDANIEVILDVVYNHTAEGNELGPMLSFKGIDNASYYRLMPDDKRYYINDTGTGNTINASHPRVVQLILDSLRYWVEVMEVDGFRFDLGTIIGRQDNGFDATGGFFQAIAQDPVLQTVKLIAEPWDIGPGGYQVGGFPPGWAEWNDKYRDTVRSYWKADEGTTRDLAARVTGSGDIYDVRGRRAWSSVNFISAHDGFTLNDLVSYNEKHNEANGEDNNDGHGDNKSYNFGVEGVTDDQAIIDVRERQKKNILATLLLSHGTPMILSGDEFGRTQDGNNNVYCQDNELGWIVWDKITDKDRHLTEFVKYLTKLRNEHPIFRRNSFRQDYTIKWFNPSGGFQTPEAWDDDGALAIGLSMSAHLDGSSDKVSELLVLFNSFDGDIEFLLPERSDDKEWDCILRTDKLDYSSKEDATFKGAFTMAPRSYYVFE